MTETLRLALYQGPSPSGDIDAAFQTIEGVLQAGAAMGARIAVFPEAYLPGYNVPETVAQPLDGEWVQRLTTLSRETGVAVCMGMAEQADCKVYNAAVVVGPQGPIANYRKIQLYGPAENARYTPGDCHVVFDFEGFKVGLLICYDIEFPEHFRLLAKAGADLVLAPTANMTPFDNVNRIATSARAMDHGLTLAYCNYCGTEGDITYLGRSVIAGPDGDPLALAGLDTALLIADVPKAKDFQHRVLSTYLEDQRRITRLTDGTESLPKGASQ